MDYLNLNPIWKPKSEFKSGSNINKGPPFEFDCNAKFISEHFLNGFGLDYLNSFTPLLTSLSMFYSICVTQSLHFWAFSLGAGPNKKTRIVNYQINKISQKLIRCHWSLSPPQPRLILFSRAFWLYCHLHNTHQKSANP